jgi:uncharacterized MnhB-related membrane protein
VSAVTAFVLVLLVVSAYAALSVDDLIEAVIIFGAFSFFAAVLYTLLQAPDVAFTEAAVGAVVTTVFFAAALHRTDPRSSR